MIALFIFHHKYRGIFPYKDVSNNLPGTTFLIVIIRKIPQQQLDSC